ncbi:hypothetical protein KY334_05740 [Candidatus Woesearchaeota archaeon]|nr:hypothetical protein [Candidatus Woesearchaeota archaeon]
MADIIVRLKPQEIKNRNKIINEYSRTHYLSNEYSIPEIISGPSGVQTFNTLVLEFNKI